MKSKSREREKEDMRQEKVRFLSLAAHEMRTPLVSIKGYTDLILNRYTEEVSERVEGILRIVAGNANRLIDLTDDLLTLRQLEGGELDIHPQPIYTGKIIEDVLGEVRPLFKGRNQSLEVDIDDHLPTLIVDRVHLEDALMLLLNAASVLTPEEEKILLKAHETENDLIVRVSCEKTRLDEPDIDKVFDPFPDIEALYSRGGSGASLCASKGIIELHNGDLWIEQKEEKGSTSFIIRLPKNQKMN